MALGLEARVNQAKEEEQPQDVVQLIFHLTDRLRGRPGN